MIIFINIVSNLPTGAATMYYLISGSGAAGAAKVAAILLILIVVLAFIVCVNTGERRLPVQYSSKMVGRKQASGRSTNMPIKVNTSGVISIIFAISLLQFPQQIGMFIPNKRNIHKGDRCFEYDTPYWCDYLYYPDFLLHIFLHIHRNQSKRNCDEHEEERWFHPRYQTRSAHKRLHYKSRKQSNTGWCSLLCGSGDGACCSAVDL